MTKKLEPIFNSFQEYIEAENMIFETLEDRVTHGTKVIK
jgi:hypothetical protein